MVTIEFPMDDWVVGYFLSFGTSLDIVQPKGMRKELAARAKKLFLHHES